MPSLIDSLSGLLGDDVVGQISQQLGTDTATTSSAISSALPLLVSALAHQSSREGGADQIAGALASHDDSVLDGLSAALGAGGGGDSLGQVFGSKGGALASMLGQSSGLDSAGASQLLGMLTPIVMAGLARNVREKGLDSAGLAGMFGAERQQLSRRLTHHSPRCSRRCSTPTTTAAWWTT